MTILLQPGQHRVENRLVPRNPGVAPPGHQADPPSGPAPQPHRGELRHDPGSRIWGIPRGLRRFHGFHQAITQRPHVSDHARGDLVLVPVADLQQRIRFLVSVEHPAPDRELARPAVGSPPAGDTHAVAQPPPADVDPDTAADLGRKRHTLGQRRHGLGDLRVGDLAGALRDPRALRLPGAASRVSDPPGQHTRDLPLAHPGRPEPNAALGGRRRESERLWIDPRGDLELPTVRWADASPAHLRPGHHGPRGHRPVQECEHGDPPGTAIVLGPQAKHDLVVLRGPDPTTAIHGRPADHAGPEPHPRVLETAQRPRRLQVDRDAADRRPRRHADVVAQGGRASLHREPLVRVLVGPPGQPALDQARPRLPDGAGALRGEVGLVQGRGGQATRDVPAISEVGHIGDAGRQGGPVRHVRLRRVRHLRPPSPFFPVHRRPGGLLEPLAFLPDPGIRVRGRPGALPRAPAVLDPRQFTAIFRGEAQLIAEQPLIGFRGRLARVAVHQGAGSFEGGSSRGRHGNLLRSGNTGHTGHRRVMYVATFASDGLFPSPTGSRSRDRHSLEWSRSSSSIGQLRRALPRPRIG